MPQASLALSQVTSLVFSDSLPSNFFWSARKEEFRKNFMHCPSAIFTSFDVNAIETERGRDTSV